MRHLVFVAVFILAVLHGTARAQGIITTFAGSDWVFPDGVPAADAPFGEPSSVTVDPAGNPVVVDPLSCVVARVEKGVVSVIAGTGLKCQGPSYTAGLSTGEGGLATSAAIDNPGWAAYDSTGNLYVLMWHQIHKISGGIITRVAGPSYNCCFNQFGGMGGPAVKANFDANGNLVIDRAVNIYFPANHRILKIAPGGIISVFAGTGEA